MSVFFFDGSTLVKRYVVEKGTVWVRSMVNIRSGHRVIIAQITSVEVLSAVARLVREQRVTARTALAIQAYVNRHAAREYIVVNLSKPILMAAQNLLFKYSLRAYDAVQLASALDINTKIMAANQRALIFVSSDVRLLTTASSEGLQTHNPV